MNINSWLFLAHSDLIVGTGRDELWLLDQDYKIRTLATHSENIRFLTASSYGEYLAFWSDSGYGFRLIDLSGEFIWSCGINGDKAMPHGLHFSTSDNAVACIYDFEGLDGLFFCDIEKQYETTFGCSGSPIGFDTDLRYFVIDGCDLYEDEKLAFYEYDAKLGDTVKVPPEIVAEKIKKSPLIVDRYRTICPGPVLSMRDWDGLVVQKGTEGIEGFVILKEGSVHWLAKDSDRPETTVNDCLPKGQDKDEWYRCAFSACGDKALVQSVRDNVAVVVHRHHGVIWQGRDLSSVTFRGRRVLAEYADGTVEVINGDGSVELKYLPTAGATRVVDIFDNVLYIAYAPMYARRLVVQKYTLSG